MKVIRGIGRAIKPLVNVPEWIGYRQLADGAKSIREIFSSIFIPARSTLKETFEEAMVRLNLTEEILQKRKNEFQRLLIIFGSGGFVLLIYGIYLLWERSMHASFACLGLAIILFIYAFRYHFWLFQIKQRKLGCSFREWLNSGFIGEK